MAPGAQVEGVGLGAIAAAAKMGDVDPLAMATWQPGEPVPFSFLVDAFDVRPHSVTPSSSPSPSVCLATAAKHIVTLSCDPCMAVPTEAQNWQYVGEHCREAAAVDGSKQISGADPGFQVICYANNVSQSIAEESKRLAMTNLLASALRTILATTPADVLPVLYLCTNRIAPAHEGIELGIGDAILMKVRDAMARARPRYKSTCTMLNICSHCLLRRGRWLHVKAG